MVKPNQNSNETSGEKRGYRELKEVVWAETGEEEAADVAVVVVAAHLLDVAVAVGAHEHVQLFPERVHGGRLPPKPLPRRGEGGSASEGEGGVFFFRVSTAELASERSAFALRDGEGNLIEVGDRVLVDCGLDRLVGRGGGACF